MQIFNSDKFKNTIDISALLLGMGVMLSAALITLNFTQSSWSRGGAIALSSLLATSRSRLGPVGVLAQGTVIIVGIFTLLCAASHPILLPVAIAFVAGICFIIIAKGPKLRSAASFTFVPILYITFEETVPLSISDVLSAMEVIIPEVFLALIPVIFVSGYNHYSAYDGNEFLSRHFCRPTHLKDHGMRKPATAAVISCMLSTALAALIALSLRLHHSEWMIWSAASVVSAEFASEKLRDRAFGALIGVPVGMILTLLFPPSPAILSVATIVALLSLSAVHSYILAFSTRCACATLGLTTSHAVSMTGAERAEDVILGGVIGVAVFYTVNWVSRLLLHAHGRGES